MHDTLTHTHAQKALHYVYIHAWQHMYKMFSLPPSLYINIDNTFIDGSKHVNTQTVLRLPWIKRMVLTIFFQESSMLADVVRRRTDSTFTPSQSSLVNNKLENFGTWANQI